MFEMLFAVLSALAFEDLLREHSAIAGFALLVIGAVALAWACELLPRVMTTRRAPALFAAVAVVMFFASPSLLATLKLSTATREAMVQAISTEIDADAGANSAGTIYVCSDASAIVACSSYVAGSVCTGASVVLAALTFAAPADGDASVDGVLTFSAITQDSSADATGTASWFQILDQPDDGSAECIYSGSVGAGSGDLSLNTTSIVSGAIVSITSATITAPNP